MLSLLGEYEVAVDQKGRFMLPAGFRRQLPEERAGNFVINRGFEKCLVLYPMETWNALSAQLKTLNDFNPKARAFKRLFLNGATPVEADGAGRLNLPKHLMEAAGISKDKSVVFSAQDNKVEIWDKDTYHAYLAEQAASYSDLAAEVAGGDFTNPLIA